MWQAGFKTINQWIKGKDILILMINDLSLLLKVIQNRNHSIDHVIKVILSIEN